jgi:hypothetical protein
VIEQRVLVGLAVLGLLLSVAPGAKAQAVLNRGVIEGIATDPQGAVIPGVAVNITSLGTNISVATKTDSAGYYRVIDLVPGEYRGRFQATGFAEVEINGIQVLPGQVQRVDASLQVGSVRQAVQVSAAAAMLQTAATNANTTLENREIQDIPLAGRDLQQLVFLLPGVKSPTGPPGALFGFNSQDGTFPDPTHTDGSNLSVNGGQGGANAWYLDGNYNVVALAMNMAVDPSPDAVEEFQVVNNSFGAQYSGTGGGVFSMVLKSGTKQLHGDIYEYDRNSYFNARNPFTSIDSFGNIIPQNQIRYNDFGGTLGGPVVIPHVYNGRNKTFFFFSWDTSILHDSGSATETVPTAAMRNGDFSEDPNAAEYGIWDPYSTVGPDAQGLFDRQAFGTPAAGNPNGCLASQVAASGGTSCNFATSVPQNRLDPTAMFFMNSFPLPNFNSPLSTCPMGNGGFRICNNYLGVVGNNQNTDNISLKIDHQWSDRNRYFAEWLYNPTNYGFYRVPWTGPTFPEGTVGWNGTYPFNNSNQIFALGNTYTLSPTWMNELRVSFTRQFFTNHPAQPFPNSITDQSDVEKVLAPSQIPNSFGYPTPSFYFDTPGGSSVSFGPAAWTNVQNMAEAYTILDNVTKVIGKHTLTTGFMYRLEHTSAEIGFPTVLNSEGFLTQNPITSLGGGAGLATFMMGAVDNSSYFGSLATSYQRARTWGLFLQDDYHVRRSLALTLGLRYDIFGWYKDRYPVDGNFCFTCANPVTGLNGAYYYFKGGHDIASPSWKDLGPRINFAWNPSKDRKTVIRGGYDIFYSNAGQMQMTPGDGGGSNGVGWSQQANWEQSFYPNQCASFTYQCVAFPLSNTTVNKALLGFPLLTPQQPAELRSPNLGESYGLIGWIGAGGGHSDPMIQMWSLEVQRELPSNLLVSAGYTGTHGSHLFSDLFRRENYAPVSDVLQYKEAFNAVVPITDYYSGKAAAGLASLYGSTSLPRSLLLTPFPFFGPTNLSTPLDGASIYNSLNVKVQKRFSHGFNFGVAYTNSKLIDNCCVAQFISMAVDSIHANGGGAGQNFVTGNVRGARYQNPDNRDADRGLDTNDIPQVLSVYGTYELPFGVGKSFLNQKGVLNQIVGGWRLTGNFIAQEGVPLRIGCPQDSLQSTISSQSGEANTSRCNLVGDPHFAGNRSKQQQIADWINPAAFEPSFGSDQNFWANYTPTDPRAWQWGNMGPVLPNMRTPGFWNVDTAVSKNFRVSESTRFEFRWEAFNALNHMNLGFPNTHFCLPPTASGVTDLVHQAGCSFGLITNIQTDPRAMDFSLKFYW